MGEFGIIDTGPAQTEYERRRDALFAAALLYSGRPYNDGATVLTAAALFERYLEGGDDDNVPT